MGRPKPHTAALRVRLLDRAAELLSSEGPQALSLRRLATDVGTSTTAVYSLFGGKAGLLSAVYDEAVRRFSERLAGMRPTGHPMADPRRLGESYPARRARERRHAGVQRLQTEDTPRALDGAELAVSSVAEAGDNEPGVVEPLVDARRHHPHRQSGLLQAPKALRSG